MKRKNLLPIVVGILLWGLRPARATDVSTGSIKGQIADWSFIQSVGGLQLGKPTQSAIYTWELPLLCDLSGKDTFTQKPTLTNSGMILQKTIVESKGKDIFISLVAAPVVWTSNPKKSQCKSVLVESNNGVHQVFYRDASGQTFPVGIIEFNLDSTVLSHPGG